MASQSDFAETATAVAKVDMAIAGLGTADPADIAEHIRDLSQELAALAQRSNLDTLARLLELAATEAGRVSASAGRDVDLGHGGR